MKQFVIPVLVLFWLSTIGGLAYTISSRPKDLALQAAFNRNGINTTNQPLLIKRYQNYLTTIDASDQAAGYVAQLVTRLPMDKIRILHPALGGESNKIRINFLGTNNYISFSGGGWVFSPFSYRALLGGTPTTNTASAGTINPSLSPTNSSMGYFLYDNVNYAGIIFGSGGGGYYQFIGYHTDGTALFGWFKTGGGTNLIVSSGSINGSRGLSGQAENGTNFVRYAVNGTVLTNRVVDWSFEGNGNAFFQPGGWGGHTNRYGATWIGYGMTPNELAAATSAVQEFCLAKTNLP